MKKSNQADLFEGFVLAGGKSSRMGENKAFLNINNKTFLQHAVQTLSPICNGGVRIVLNQNQSSSKDNFKYIHDIYSERGALGGLHTAFIHSIREWSVVLACDLPLVTTERITELSKLALESEPDVAAIVPVQEDGKLQPLCALYRPSLCLDTIENLLQTRNSVSMREFLTLIKTVYVETNRTPIHSKSEFYNVNTPADYKSLFEK